MSKTHYHTSNGGPFKTQTELFNWIHKSELSGKPLLPKGALKWHWQFLHVLPKGSYPSYKLNPDNILLALPEEHEKQMEFELFCLKYNELKRRYYKEIYHKNFE
jgi:hypothetical protein